MKVGIQTIFWGPRPLSIPAMLDEVKDAGYEGVELMQDPKVLGDPERLFEELEKRQLALVGIAGGSLEERVDYAQKVKAIANSNATSKRAVLGMHNALPLELPYVYVDDWREEQHRAVLEQADVVIALHPHMFKPVQTTEEAVRVLETHPQMRFLPDTAHLVVAGEDPMRVISNNLGWLAAVHLKDWTAEFGRSYPFYSRGFIELGQGNVPVLDVVQMLLAHDYRGWLMVEQDATANPAASAKQSRQWLREQTGV